MYDRILVPTDGSQGADRAIDEAIPLAKEFAATVHALYVLDPRMSPIDADMDPADVDTLLERAKHVPTETVLERAAAADVTATAAHRVGIPHETIPAFVTEAGIGLVVMGTHGRTGLGRFFLGSVTEAVVRRSPVPVMTVRSLPVAVPDEE